MPRKLSVVYFSAGDTVEGTGPVHPLDENGSGGLLSSGRVVLHSTVPDCRGLDPDVRKAEWSLEVGNRIRDGAMPLVQPETVATFGLNDEVVSGVESGEAGLLVGVSFRGFGAQGDERVSAEDGTIIREPGVYLAAVPDPEKPGREEDLLDNPGLFTLHDGILLYRAEPRHLRHRPFPYLVFSINGT